VENNANDQTFNRLSLQERGHFSNLPTLFPIEKIIVNERGMMIKRRFLQEAHVEWAEIVSVSLIKEKGYKSYGKGAHARCTFLTLQIITPNGEFKIDVSRQFPDFRNGRQLIDIINNNKKIERIERINKKDTTMRDGLIFSAVLLLFGLSLYILKQMILSGKL